MNLTFPSPCKGCEKREVGCHSSCKAYLDAKEEHKVAVDAFHREHQGEIDAYNYIKESRERTIKHNRDRKDRK